MRKPLIIAIIILLIIIIGIISYFIYTSQDDNVSSSCTDKGCLDNAIYVGSINSDKYYECDCYYADRILPENIICFISDEDALSKGYVKSEC